MILCVDNIELIKNPRYDFWKQPFTRCAPEIERLFESVARSCMPAGKSAVGGASTGGSLVGAPGGPSDGNGLGLPGAITSGGGGGVTRGGGPSTAPTSDNLAAVLASRRPFMSNSDNM
jgi:hypothetical protein